MGRRRIAETSWAGKLRQRPWIDERSLRAHHRRRIGVSSLMAEGGMYNIVVATTPEGLIGVGGSSVWDLDPIARDWLRQRLRGQILIVGRVSYGILQPEGSHVFVLTRQITAGSRFTTGDVTRIGSFAEAVKTARLSFPTSRIRVIGGEKVFERALQDPRLIRSVEHVIVPSGDQQEEGRLKRFPIEELEKPPFVHMKDQPFLQNPHLTLRMYVCPTRSPLSK
jgi:dihydrofolate reductase